MKRRIKELLKAILKRSWVLTGPVRRPLVRKLDAHLTRIVLEAGRAHATQTEASAASLQRLEASVNLGRHVVESQNAEANLLFDGLVREVARLQLQVEALQESVEDLRERGPLAVLGHEEPAEDVEIERRAG